LCSCLEMAYRQQYCNKSQVHVPLHSPSAASNFPKQKALTSAGLFLALVSKLGAIRALSKHAQRRAQKGR
jgi:hypothetical protein